MMASRAVSSSGRFDYLRLARLVRSFRMRGSVHPQDGSAGASGASRLAARSSISSRYAARRH
jgi:hypothetical protein